MNKKFTKSLIRQIDWRPLEQRITKLLGVPITFTVSINDRGKLNITSEDIVNHAGVMRANFKTLHVDNFGSFLEDKELTFPVHFSYTHKEGGSNGSCICWVKYRFKSKQWVFGK